MADASRTPATTAATNPTQQLYSLLKQISKADRADGLTFGGVDFTPGVDRITATVVFPVERIETAHGEELRIVPMTK